MRFLSTIIMLGATTALMPGVQDAATQTGDAGVADSASITTPRFIPFGVGERISYDVRYSPLRIGNGSRVGTAAMEVLRIEDVRGRPAYNVQLRVQGKVLWFKYNSTLTSWMDTTSLNSLKFFSDQEQNGDDRERFYDIFPDRELYKLRWNPDTLPLEESVTDPLDDASFLYFVRTTTLEVGKTYEYNRYFRPDRNPVIVKVLAREEVTVPAGKFPAILIQPVIKAKGLFSEGGEAKVWISDDAARIILRIESKTPVTGALHLEMTGYAPPKR